MQSMTGYGRSEVENEQFHFTVEMRSVNHRYLDISLRYPRAYASLEAQMKQLVGKYFARGRIEISIVQQTLGSGERMVTLDHALAKQYYQAFQQLKETLGLSGVIDLESLLAQRDILKIDEIDGDAEAAWDLLARGLDEASQALSGMRAREGRVLGEDLKARIHTVHQYIEGIRQRVPEVVTDYRHRLEERVAELFERYQLDPDRLTQEVVLLSERTDVAEELTRLDAHIEALSQLLEETDALGRKSEFLMQEINREVNTIASKSNNAQIAQDVVEIKAELERMREQIQNVE